MGTPLGGVVSVRIIMMCQVTYIGVGLSALARTVAKVKINFESAKSFREKCCGWGPRKPCEDKFADKKNGSSHTILCKKMILSAYPTQTIDYQKLT